MHFSVPYSLLCVRLKVFLRKNIIKKIFICFNTFVYVFGLNGRISFILFYAKNLKKITKCDIINFALREETHLLETLNSFTSKGGAAMSRILEFFKRWNLERKNKRRVDDARVQAARILRRLHDKMKATRS